MSAHITTHWLCCQVHLDGVFKWPSDAKLLAASGAEVSSKWGGESPRIENSNIEALKSVKTCGYSCKALPNCSFQHDCTRIFELGARHKHEEEDWEWMDCEGREIHEVTRLLAHDGAKVLTLSGVDTFKLPMR